MKPFLLSLLCLLQFLSGECQSDSTAPLRRRHSRAPVTDGKKNGFMDLNTGKMAIPFTYQDAHQFDPNMGIAAVRLNGKWGFIDSAGSTVIPFQFEQVTYRFNNWGLCAVRKNGKWGFIDAAGKEVIPFQFDKAEGFPHGSYIDVQLKGKPGRIDEWGNFQAAEKTSDGTRFYRGKPGRNRPTTVTVPKG